MKGSTSPDVRLQRLVRGMTGFGATFGAIAAVAWAVTFSATLIASPTTLGFHGPLAVIMTTILWSFVAFVLGVVYAGLLSLLARRRLFRELSVSLSATAGAVVGLVPFAIIAAAYGGGGKYLFLTTIAVTGNATADLVKPLVLFPAIGALIGAATLLIARRAPRASG